MNYRAEHRRRVRRERARQRRKALRNPALPVLVLAMLLASRGAS